jgi:hypothetical protein
MSGHPQFEEEFDLYAIGALDADEKRAFEEHLFAPAPNVPASWRRRASAIRIWPLRSPLRLLRRERGKG